ncbi:IS66 family transposase [Pelagibaculum spongiae]|uniref:IS66 family transposase n=1 Tax=Pelagibaculum spongiae TaxID=2080658 RepID=A0A2V1GZN3_9GAMM|nr:IS66 family transposase [Pelagibaculum spongiae]PVZ71653.1 IS66 family transposase [Pelagibaculum spongiae]
MDSIEINKTIAETERLLAKSKRLPPELVAMVRMLMLVVKILLDSKGLNSKNSSIPPSADPNREKKSRAKSNKNPGGQPGHKGSNLSPVKDPDEVLDITIDRSQLPKGKYRVVGSESRQVVDVRITRYVTEYRAQILQDEQGNQFVAEFPQGVTRPIQYGNEFKANAVYMSSYQLIPYERTQKHFAEILDAPISTGSLANFNQEAFHRLKPFAQLVPAILRAGDLIHADETGVNINGKRKWLHVASNDRWTWIEAHESRGIEAMEAIDILPKFTGLLVHDHWKSYYRFVLCLHVLCNAHHVRELARAHEQDGQQWAKAMEDLLYEMNTAVNEAGGELDEKQCQKWVKRYRKILKAGDRECPAPEPKKADKKGQLKRGKLARSKSRNLLERLRDFEADVLRFMSNTRAPFTNNQGERDFRMSTVQQKISGCFRSWDGVTAYCRIRSYISTCQKHGVGVGEALSLLFAGKWPDFIQKKLDRLV